jgi:hypothetical protein
MGLMPRDGNSSRKLAKKVTMVNSMYADMITVWAELEALNMKERT